MHTAMQRSNTAQAENAKKSLASSKQTLYVENDPSKYCCQPIHCESV